MTEKSPPAETKNDENQARQIETTATRLVKYCLTIPEQLMRASYLSEKLVEMPDDQLLEVLRFITKKAIKRVPPFMELMREASKFNKIHEMLGPYRISRIYHAAVRKKYSTVMDFFSSSKPRLSDEGDTQAFELYGYPDKTIGERRQMARNHNPLVLDKLGYDPDPEVIRRILFNPRTTEQDVIKITSRRPNKPELLDVIYNNAKWIGRYQVRIALARNPYAYPRTALAILTTLMIQDIRDIANDPNLHPEVLSRAKEILFEKQK